LFAPHDRKRKEAGVMMRKTLTSLAIAAGCLTMAAGIPAVQAMQPGDQVITNGPQSSGVEDSGTWSARANVIQSERYQRLVNDDAAFRRARMIKECGPVTDPQLHEQCIASFNRGSSTASSE
jgi:hypothetical protein